jgi:hypothetical protein
MVKKTQTIDQARSEQLKLNELWQESNARAVKFKETKQTWGNILVSNATQSLEFGQHGKNSC